MIGGSQTTIGGNELELGLFLMPLHYPSRLHADTFQEDLELMEYADRLGYAEAWIGEHFLLPFENMPSPELFIARALGVTEKMAFGTGVSLLGFHNPAHIAHRIAQLDHMARGRIYLGIGAGGGAMDAEMFDIDLEEGSQRERMAECVEIILKIWEGEPFEYEGRFYKSRLSPPQPERRLGFHMKPYQKPHPPIAVAGSSPYSSTPGDGGTERLDTAEQLVPAREVPAESPRGVRARGEARRQAGAVELAHIQGGVRS